ncbi:MAG: hypothetical protein ACK5RL_00880 [Acidimicrobiales bacterium]
MTPEPTTPHHTSPTPPGPAPVPGVTTTVAEPDARELRRERRRRVGWILRQPESIGAVAMVVFAAGIPSLLVSWVSLLLLPLFLLLHYATVAGGNHVLLWLTTGVVFLEGLIALAGLAGTETVVFAAIGLLAFAYNDLTRLSFLRRRDAVVDPGVIIRALVGLGAVAGCTLVGALALQTADPSGGGSLPSGFWLLGLAGVVVIALVLMVAPPRRGTDRRVTAVPRQPSSAAPRPRLLRWTPGDRIPPQPLGRDEIA